MWLVHKPNLKVGFQTYTFLHLYFLRVISLLIILFLLFFNVNHLSNCFPTYYKLIFSSDFITQIVFCPLLCFLDCLNSSEPTNLYPLPAYPELVCNQNNATCEILKFPHSEQYLSSFLSVIQPHQLPKSLASLSVTNASMVSNSYLSICRLGFTRHIFVLSQHPSPVLPREAQQQTWSHLKVCTLSCCSWAAKHHCRQMTQLKSRLIGSIFCSDGNVPYL